MVSSLMGIGKDEFTQFFEVAVQLGAILAVVVLYWRKFFRFRDWKFYAKLVVAVIPAAAFGLVAKEKIDLLLINPLYSALTILGGGFILLFIDNFFIAQRLRKKKISLLQMQ